MRSCYQEWFHWLHHRRQNKINIQKADGNMCLENDCSTWPREKARRRTKKSQRYIFFHIAVSRRPLSKQKTSRSTTGLETVQTSPARYSVSTVHPLGHRMAMLIHINETEGNASIHSRWNLNWVSWIKLKIQNSYILISCEFSDLKTSNKTKLVPIALYLHKW